MVRLDDTDRAGEMKRKAGARRLKKASKVYPEMGLKNLPRHMVVHDKKKAQEDDPIRKMLGIPEGVSVQVNDS